MPKEILVFMAATRPWSSVTWVPNRREAKRAPYIQYLAVLDSRTRPGHRALHGKVFPIDSPVWDIIAPPNGWNCRCRARNLSEAVWQKIIR